MGPGVGADPGWVPGWEQILDGSRGGSRSWMGPGAGADPGWVPGREQILDESQGGSRSWMACGAAPQACAQARCASCMFFTIAAATACSSRLGLNWTNSVPAAASGMWPGGV